MGGDLTFNTYEELIEVFGKRTASDGLENSSCTEHRHLLAPVREHFASGEPKQALETLREAMKRVKLR